MRNYYIVAYLIAFFSLIASCSGSSRQTPATAALVGLANLLDSYKRDHSGKLPRDWESFFSDQPISFSATLEIQDYLDVKNRYQFLAFEKPFVIHGLDELFIVMANQSGEEGDQQEPGRFVIVETSGGEIQTRRYTEKTLKGVFQRSGYNLSDYTHILSSLPKSNIKTLPSKSNSNPSATQNKERLIDSKSRGDQKTSRLKDTLSDRWLYLTSGILFLFILPIYIYFMCRGRPL